MILKKEAAISIQFYRVSTGLYRKFYIQQAIAKGQVLFGQYWLLVDFVVYWIQLY